MNMLFWFAMMLLGLSAPLAGIGFQESEYCAFEVIIRTSRGEPVRYARVVLFDNTGAAFASAVVNEEGIARICDAPPGLLRLSVGGTLCGTASVGQITRYWMQTRKVTITFDNCSGEDLVPMAGCMLTIRAKAKSGAILEGATFLKSREYVGWAGKTLVSDRWGRIFQSVKFRELLAGSIQKAGYLSQEISVQCTREPPLDRDITVVLEVKPAK